MTFYFEIFIGLINIFIKKCLAFLDYYLIYLKSWPAFKFNKAS